MRVLLLPAEWAGKRTIRYVIRRRGQAADSSARPSSRKSRSGCENRRPDPCRPARAERRRSCVLPAGRELPPRARRALRLVDPARHLPPRARRGERGRGIREADGTARDLPRHAGSGRDPGRGRGAHVEAGLVADCCSSSARCRARFAVGRRGRSSTTRRCSAASRRLRGSSTAPSGSPSTWPRRLSIALPEDPGPACLRCRRTCSASRQTSRTLLGSSPRTGRRAQTTSLACRSFSRLPSARSSSWGREAGPPRRAATCRRSARRISFRSHAPSAVRTSSTTARRATSACSASRWTRRSPRGCATPISCSRSADGSARCRRAGTRSSSRRTRDRRSSTSIRTRASSAACICRTWRSPPRFPSSPRRCERPGSGSSPTPADTRGRPQRAPSTRRTSSTSRWRGRRPRRDHGVPPAAASRRRRADVRGGQLHRLGASLRRVHGVRDAGVPALGLDGLRTTGSGRRAARPSGARRRLLHGRRRLRDELAGARHRSAVRTPDRDPPREQRHVRDDPHAPGAHVSAPRDRHRSREPRLPGARPGLRRARRASRAYGGLRGRLRAGARFGEAGGARVARRPRADQPPSQAERAERRQMNARLRLAFVGETMFPPRAPFFLKTWGTSRFPTPLPTHVATEVAT